MFFKKDETVVLIEDLKHYRTIFGNAEVSTPQVTTQLKAGRELAVVCHYNDGGVLCERNGSFYDVPEEIIKHK